MLALIVADRDLLGVVQQDVRRHQRGIREKPGQHVFIALFGRFVLELGHTGEFAVANRALHDPRQLGVLRYVTLHKHARPLGIEASGKKEHGRFSGLGPERRRIASNGEGMQVDHSVETVRGLVADPAHDRSDEVPQVFLASRLDTGQYAGHEPASLEVSLLGNACFRPGRG